jgi:hypothetical protein
MTDDGVVIPMGADAAVAQPEVKVDGDRVFLTLHGLELAPSISIKSQNTRPEASLIKRRLSVKQTGPRVVEISLAAGQQEWTVTLHSQGLSLLPTAVSSSQWNRSTVSQAQPLPKTPQGFPIEEDIVETTIVATATNENPLEQTVVLSSLPESNSSNIPEEVGQVAMVAQAEQTAEIKKVEELQVVGAPVLHSNLDVILSNEAKQEKLVLRESELEEPVVGVIEEANSNPPNLSEMMAPENADNESQEVVSIRLADAPPPSVLPNYFSKLPVLVAQSPPKQPTVEELREQLLIPPVPDDKLARIYYPTLTYGVPSAFGPGWGDLYISATGATPGNDRDGQVDGSISMGFGLGDPAENVGLNFAYNIGSINNFGQNGTFDMSASRIVYQDPITAVAIAAGWSDFARYGSDAVEDSTVWGTMTSYSFLRPDDPVNKLPLLLSLGAGGGYFRQDPASTGVFGGLGLQIAPQVGVGLQWSGVGLNLGLSFVPVPTIPLTLTATGADLTSNSPGGTRFVLSLSYGFNFLPPPGAR